MTKETKTAKQTREREERERAWIRFLNEIDRQAGGAVFQGIFNPVIRKAGKVENKKG